VDQLSHSVTQCQRLTKPAVAPVMSAHTLRLLTVWIFTLPLTLFEKLPPEAIPAFMAIIAWALLGLHELGVGTRTSSSSFSP
jgi:predicted membrane chloride channel (bestrophin family)